MGSRKQIDRKKWQKIAQFQLLACSAAGYTSEKDGLSCRDEAPAVIESYYNKRIVGCPGGEGEDEHDVVWFWLKKDEPHECPVCSQYFVLKVIGDGGDPDGHDDDDEHHH